MSGIPFYAISAESPSLGSKLFRAEVTLWDISNQPKILAISGEKAP